MTRFALAALPAVCAASLVAQTPPPVLSSQQPPLRASTLVVEVDTIVVDGKRQFVPGLTAEDFEVLEDGKPQQIQHVYAVTENTAAAPPESTAAAAREAVAGGAAVPPSPARQRVFVLLFDSEHLQEGAFKRLRDAAIDFLNKEFKPGDVGGVVIGAAMSGNQLTSDREALLTAVRNAKPNATKTARRGELLEWPRFNSEAIRIALSNDREVLAQAVRRACQDDPSFCKNIDPEPVVMEKARSIVGEMRPPAMRTVRTLQALASGLARLPGRKTIVLMTEGFFVEESWADLREIVGAAARSNVRIYSLDGRGLDTRQVNDPRQMSLTDPGGSIPLEAYNSIEDGPNMLAVDTGGYPIRHTNKFAEALTEIAHDTSNYYVIGYTPTKAMDGSFRRIGVRVKRQGLTVRARRGYLATPGLGKAAAPTPTAEVAAPATTPPASTPPGSSVPAVAVAEPATAAAPPPPTDASATTTPSSVAAPPVSGAIVLRPDSGGRVAQLASREGGTAAATGLASQGWDRYQKGDLEGAAALLGKAAIDPQVEPWVRYALGYSELGLGHPQKAAESWEEVRAAAPEFRPVYLDLADAYLKMQTYTRAIDVLRTAQSRWPGDVDVLNAMGTIQVRRGALDDAISTFRKAVDAKPDDATAYFNLGRTYELRYFKMRRYSPVEGRWLANPADVKNAVASYEQYLKLGGPFEQQAREALQNLQWPK
jgi:VWFA-related protein